MPRIRWSGLPPALRDHLFDRLRERKITAADLYQLKAWRESNPDAPEGFGTRTSVRSQSVATENTRRPSCLRAKQPKGSNQPRFRAGRPPFFARAVLNFVARFDLALRFGFTTTFG